MAFQGALSNAQMTTSSDKAADFASFIVGLARDHQLRKLATTSGHAVSAIAAKHGLLSFVLICFVLSEPNLPNSRLLDWPCPAD
jgi:hypothetical protein